METVLELKGFRGLEVFPLRAPLSSVQKTKSDFGSGAGGRR